ncbi:hypothetical protein P691DRAFT_802295 [Macrolepiota fuliginosa MF-IS2]|uniref:Uncharacterized protein n=1 Tax=Macrolepiota fuliginosa MF-IS2 TaxID=1400762 RepID=A0A9P6BUP4_9AGAR|nr:hypothetical protein P691DRAFT_802295 [Macrolepiota fuliginosa MF-IS2]
MPPSARPKRFRPRARPTPPSTLTSPPTAPIVRYFPYLDPENRPPQRHSHSTEPQDSTPGPAAGRSISPDATPSKKSRPHLDRGKTQGHRQNRGKGGIFNGAHNFVMHNTVINDINGSDNCKRYHYAAPLWTKINTVRADIS